MSGETLLLIITLLQKHYCRNTIEDQTIYLTQSQYTGTGPTRPSTDRITPGTWQGSHWSANFEVTGMTGPGKVPTVQADNCSEGLWPLEWDRQLDNKLHKIQPKADNCTQGLWPLEWDRQLDNKLHKIQPKADNCSEGLWPLEWDRQLDNKLHKIQPKADNCSEGLWPLEWDRQLDNKLQKIQPKVHDSSPSHARLEITVPVGWALNTNN